MVAGSAFVVGLGRRDRTPAPTAPHVRPAEKPWLSQEAAAQVIDSEGGPGPLFEGLYLGGTAPSPAERARIDEFAQRNHVQIGFDVLDDELVAIRFGVTYGGCCGYEAADLLARRLQQPHTGGCVSPEMWWNDWVFVREDSVHVRARLRVNRVEVRWEHTVTLAEVLERADSLLGQDVDKLRATARDRWFELAPHQFLIEAPLPAPSWSWTTPVPGDRGFVLSTHAGKVVEVIVALPRVDTEVAAAALRARWGRPHTDEYDDWSWRRSDRVITADPSGGSITITQNSKPLPT